MPPCDLRRPIFGCARTDVSILVLVDAALRLDAMVNQGIIPDDVSILVLVDAALRQTRRGKSSFPNSCFNPCFSGCRPATLFPDPSALQVR